MAGIPQAYSGAQKALHWLMALLVVVMLAVGLSLPRLGPGPLTNTLYEIHKSTGMLLLALVLVRLALRFRRGAPPLDPTLPLWQRRAAAASHAALYGLLIVMPIAGWAGTSACCRPVEFLWTVPMTMPVPPGDAVTKPAFALHLALGLALIALIGLHAAAALHHHFVRRDDTLRRMLPGAGAVRPSTR